MDEHRLRIPARRPSVVTLDGHTWVTFDHETVAPWVCERTGLEYKKDRFRAIGRLIDGKLVAGVLYEEFNGAQIVCHIAAEGKWANKHFLWLIFDYPFNQVGASRITTTVVDSNKKSQAFTKKLGFDLEYKMKSAHPDGDLWVFRMFKDDCRWLRNANAIHKHRSCS